MLNTDWQKWAIAVRRDKRDRQRDGWEYVGDGGGKLWELNRGCRIGYKITDVAIARDGIGLWIKTADQFSRPTPGSKEKP